MLPVPPRDLRQLQPLRRSHLFQFTSGLWRQVLVDGHQVVCLPSRFRVCVNRYQNKHDQDGQIRYNVPMRTVNISDLKAQLSAHIQLVKDGEEVLICDRNKPVARIVPCRTNDRSKQEQRLIARGVLTPPLKRRISTVPLPEPPGDISDDVMEQVWREERQGR